MVCHTNGLGTIPAQAEPVKGHAPNVWPGGVCFAGENLQTSRPKTKAIVSFANTNCPGPISVRPEPVEGHAPKVWLGAFLSRGLLLHAAFDRLRLNGWSICKRYNRQKKKGPCGPFSPIRPSGVALIRRPRVRC